MIPRLFWPSLTTAVMLALTTGLGVWQVERLRWKTELLREIDLGEAAPARLLPASPQSPTPPPFTKVRVSGLLRQDLQVLYGVDVRDTLAGPVMGAYMLEPLERLGADPVIVNRGWVPLDRAQPGSPVDATVEGYVRAPERPGLFSLSDDPTARRFYSLDPAAIAASLGLPHAAPFTLVALGSAPRGTYPEPATEMPRPPNNHLTYAITWFSLSVILVVIFTIFVRQTLRARVKEPA
ncbi:MAG TPA: SURF1 family protein [Acetobacteraceae bacterium]